MSREQWQSIPVPLETLTSQIIEKDIEHFAKVIGKPVDVARVIFFRCEEVELLEDPNYQKKLLNDEITVMPIFLAIKEINPDDPITLVPSAIKEISASNRIKIGVKRAILALGRIAKKQETLEALRDGEPTAA